MKRLLKKTSYQRDNYDWEHNNQVICFTCSANLQRLRKIYNDWIRQYGTTVDLNKVQYKDSFMKYCESIGYPVKQCCIASVFGSNYKRNYANKVIRFD